MTLIVAALTLWKGGHCAIVPEMGEMFASGTRIVIQPLHKLAIPSKNNKSFWSKTYFLVRGLLTPNQSNLMYIIMQKNTLKICRAVEKEVQNPWMPSHSSKIYIKVHIFWEGHKFLQNLHHRFVVCSNGQIYAGDFAKCCGLLKIYELLK